MPPPPPQAPMLLTKRPFNFAMLVFVQAFMLVFIKLLLINVLPFFVYQINHEAKAIKEAHIFHECLAVV